MVSLCENPRHHQINELHLHWIGEAYQARLRIAFADDRFIR